jgi:hypothetical protein
MSKLRFIPATIAANQAVGVFQIEHVETPGKGIYVPIAFLTERISVEQVNYVLDLVREGYEVLEKKKNE